MQVYDVYGFDFWETQKYIYYDFPHVLLLLH